MFVKKYNERRDVTNSDKDQVVQAGSAVQVDKPGASKIPETMPKEVPGTSEVSENSQLQPRNFPVRKIPEREVLFGGRPGL